MSAEVVNMSAEVVPPEEGVERDMPPEGAGMMSMLLLEMSMLLLEKGMGSEAEDRDLGDLEAPENPEITITIDLHKLDLPKLYFIISSMYKLVKETVLRHFSPIGST